MTRSDEYIYQVERYLMRKHGVDTAYRDIDALRWYINTGRASAGFLRLLYQAKPYMIARQLHKGGSVIEVVERIKQYIGWEGNTE